MPEQLRRSELDHIAPLIQIFRCTVEQGKALWSTRQVDEKFREDAVQKSLMFKMLKRLSAVDPAAATALAEEIDVKVFGSLSGKSWEGER